MQAVRAEVLTERAFSRPEMGVPVRELPADTGGVMKITKRWIKKWKPSSEFIDWFWAQEERDAIKILRKLIEEKRFYSAEWMVIQLLRKAKDKTRYETQGAWVTALAAFRKAIGIPWEDVEIKASAERAEYGLSLLEKTKEG